MTARLLAATAIVTFAAITAPALAQSSCEWCGPYIGGAVGYAERSDASGERVLFDTDRDGAFGDTVRTAAGADAFSPGFCNGAANGRTPGEGCRVSEEGNLNLALRAGYDWQFGDWVFGGVAEIAQARIGDDVTAFSTTPASYTFSRDLDYTFALRARAGYAVGRFLPYVTAGVAKGEIDHSFTTTNMVNSFTRSDGGDNWGYQVGVGVERMWGDYLSFGLEYLYTSLDDDEYVVDVGPGTAGLTNPFRIVNPNGTFMRRSEDKFEYGAVNVTVAWRY